MDPLPLPDFRRDPRGTAESRVDRARVRPRDARRPARAHRPRLVLDTGDDLRIDDGPGDAPQPADGVLASHRRVAPRVPEFGVRTTGRDRPPQRQSPPRCQGARAGARDRHRRHAPWLARDRRRPDSGGSGGVDRQQAIPHRRQPGGVTARSAGTGSPARRGVGHDSVVGARRGAIEHGAATGAGVGEVEHHRRAELPHRAVPVRPGARRRAVVPRVRFEAFPRRHSRVPLRPRPPEYRGAQGLGVPPVPRISTSIGASMWWSRRWPPPSASGWAGRGPSPTGIRHQVGSFTTTCAGRPGSPLRVRWG